MCGRFTLAVVGAELESEFEGTQFPSNLAPRFNIAPSQPVLAIPNDGRNVADFFVWGLIPSWAKDPSIGSRLINARGETLGAKPSFRSSYRYQRCVIPADGFYEWKASQGSKLKVPYYIQLADGRPFGLAGLWAEWHAPDGSMVRSCTIVTTVPNELMATIHSRMPVILNREDRSVWLDPAPKAPPALDHVLRPYSVGPLRAFPVSTTVNSPANDRPECILPI